MIIVKIIKTLHYPILIPRIIAIGLFMGGSPPAGARDVLACFYVLLIDYSAKTHECLFTGKYNRLSVLSKDFLWSFLNRAGRSVVFDRLPHFARNDGD
jgi:hypothetical protein